MPIVEMASVIAPALIMFHVVSKNKATVNGEAKAVQPQPEPEAGFSTEVRTKAAALILSSCFLCCVLKGCWVTGDRGARGAGGLRQHL